MIWLALLVLAALTVAPLAFVLRHAGRARDRRDVALALHRAQLDELARDFAEQRIGAAEHDVAMLEVQRRLLAADAVAEMPPRASSRWPLLAAVVLMPLAALALYLPGSSPSTPALPLADRIAMAERQQQEDGRLVDQLRQRLATLAPASEPKRAGLVLLGNVEAARGNLPAAAKAWQEAMAIRFEPVLAAETAEALREQAGHITPEARRLFELALAQAPADAPWRQVVEGRLKEP